MFGILDRFDKCIGCPACGKGAQKLCERCDEEEEHVLRSAQVSELPKRA